MEVTTRIKIYQKRVKLEMLHQLTICRQKISLFLQLQEAKLLIVTTRRNEIMKEDTNAFDFNHGIRDYQLFFDTPKLLQAT